MYIEKHKQNPFTMVDFLFTDSRKASDNKAFLEKESAKLQAYVNKLYVSQKKINKMSLERENYDNIKLENLSFIKAFISLSFLNKFINPYQPKIYIVV